ncbi:hypothetical protein RBY4I_2496 [Rhodobacterales bacterium Y4I]|nr:hypothetical protein RBY4I_2496 [Rhodobacterales bacterium Y4I]
MESFIYVSSKSGHGCENIDLRRVCAYLTLTVFGPGLRPSLEPF